MINTPNVIRNTIIVSVVFIIAMIGLSCALPYLNVTTQNCKVTDKESISTNKSHQYRVYTSCGTYIIEDQFVRFNFDTADRYGALEKGKTYSLTTSGYRVPFLSMFKAINDLKEVK